jgi:hypothetical protein
LANRKVKTVTVRADGTIVASDESSAGVEPLPAVRPNVPEVPGATSEEDGDADSIGAVLQALNGDGEVPDLTGLSGEGSDTSAAARALDATSDEATDTTANDDPNAPVPLPRPTGLERPELSLASRQASVNTSTGNNASTSSGSSRPTPTIIRPPSSSSSSSASSGSSTSTASNSAPISLDGGSSTSQPAPTPSPTLTPVSPDSAPYFVQLSSQRSEAAARESAGALSRRFSSQLAGVNLAIQRVDLPERGTFFRVKVPTANQSQASALCNSIKSAGGDCFVTEQ